MELPTIAQCPHKYVMQRRLLRATWLEQVCPVCAHALGASQVEVRGALPLAGRRKLRVVREYVPGRGWVYDLA
jgi:hypothetical protein